MDKEKGEIMSVPEMKEYSNGRKEWLLNGILHRTDGPAVEYSDGTKEWWLNGELHRTDGPAIEDSNGSKAWYLNGELHRTDGPAVEWSNGSKYWYLNGNVVTWFEVYCFNLRTGDIQTAERILAMRN
jgi:hypothetical protein